jgi:hypothetical protein
MLLSEIIRVHATAAGIWHRPLAGQLANGRLGRCVFKGETLPQPWGATTLKEFPVVTPMPGFHRAQADQRPAAAGTGHSLHMSS